MLTYRPGSKNTKPDALSRQFSINPSNHDPEPILLLACIVGAATWQVEECVCKAQGSAAAAHPAPTTSMVLVAVHGPLH